MRGGFELTKETKEIIGYVIIGLSLVIIGALVLSAMILKGEAADFVEGDIEFQVGIKNNPELDRLKFDPEESNTTLKALELDPLSVQVNHNLLWAYWATQRFNESIIQCHKTLEISCSAAEGKKSRSPVIPKPLG